MRQTATTTWPQAQRAAVMGLPAYAGHVVVALALAWLVRDHIALLVLTASISPLDADDLATHVSRVIHTMGGWSGAQPLLA